MKLFATITAAFALLASAATAQPPTIIDPTTLGPQSFADDFTVTPLSAGPAQTATNPNPTPTYRSIVKGWTGGPTKAAADASGSSDTATTWFGYDGDGYSTPYGQGATGLVINTTFRAQPFGHTWRSGQLNTKFSFSQLHGYFEIYANMPTCVKGTWPAFWLLPITGTWPHNGEIDTPEIVGGGTAFFTAHTGVAGQPSQAQVSAPVNCTRGFHKYGVLWTPTTLAYYIDRALIGSVPTPSDYTVPMYMIVDVNMGDATSWPGAPVAPASGGPSLVQTYIKTISAWPLP